MASYKISTRLASIIYEILISVLSCVGSYVFWQVMYITYKIFIISNNFSNNYYEIMVCGVYGPGALAVILALAQV